MFKKLRRFNSSLPYSPEDYIKVPKWYVYDDDEDEDEDPIYQMLDRADRRADEILKDV